MKKLFCSILISFIYFSLFAFSFSEKLPKDKSIKSIVEFMKTECPLVDGSFDMNKSGDESFEYFFENNMEDWIVPFCKAFATQELKSYHYRFGYGSFNNPISTAIRNENYELAKEIILAAPDLVNMRDTSGQFDGAEPIRYAVEADKLDLVQLMLKSIPDINKVICATDKEEWGQVYCRSNILTYAKSEVMKNLLIKSGCKTFIPYDGNYYKESSVRDDNVNIRDAPGFAGKKIDKLNNGTKIIVLGWNCFKEDIDNCYGNWVFIQYGNGKKGYIWSKYIDHHPM